MKMKAHDVVMLASLGVAVVAFALSVFAPILKAVSFIFLGVGLAILTFKTFKARNEQKKDRPHKRSQIDAMLDGEDDEPIKKRSLADRSEEFGGKLLPLALLFFTIVAFAMSIMMITRL